jgi:alpha-beta hydrolase superfamily lysophospholipase
MRSIDTTVDVTGTIDTGGPLVLALTVHLPDEPAAPDVVVVGLPGGGYNRGYYDLHLDGLDGYSQAEYHTARGWVVIACDTIGVGESTGSDHPFTILEVGTVQDAAVQQIRQRLTDGELVDGLPAAPDALVVGLGQSMGGCFTVATQGDHGSYDAVGILGWSALHTELPLPDGSMTDVPETEARDEAAREAVTAALMASFRFAFHWEDVPAAVVAADMATVPMRDGADVVPWGVGGRPHACGIDMLTPGILAEQAASITVPVLIAQGVRDVVPRPRDEPSAYSGSDDITVFVVQTMAHMHNFASTREEFWARIQAWGDGLLLTTKA